MLVHICCSVDSHYFLKMLQQEFTSENIIAFFYDPNIHPYSEYKLRLLDVQYSCDKLGIELIEGEYDFDHWLSIVSGLEQEPEKGERCTVCFDNRLEISAKKALELGDKSFTTTLLISPLKSQEKLKDIGYKLANKYELEFVFKDYRSGQGLENQSQEVKENKIYRQNYCGCMYALNMQRDSQDKLCDELISPLGTQVLPESIESRIELYEKRNSLEKDNKDYKVVKEKFLNYRLLNASVKVANNVIASYFICYSTLQNKKVKGKIEHVQNSIHYLNKGEVKLIDLNSFNKFTDGNYSSVKELMWSPLKFNDELEFRNSILSSSYNLSCLIILDTIPNEKIEIYCHSEIYEDVKEVII